MTPMISARYSTQLGVSILETSSSDYVEFPVMWSERYKYMNYNNIRQIYFT